MNPNLAKIAFDASKVSLRSAAGLLKSYGPKAVAQAEVLRALSKVVAPATLIATVSVATTLVKAAHKKRLHFCCKIFGNEFRFEADDDLR